VLTDGFLFVFVCDAYRLFVIPTADLGVALRTKYSELVTVIHFLSFSISSESLGLQWGFDRQCYSKQLKKYGGSVCESNTPSLPRR
jgi:hypothetical protein